MSLPAARPQVWIVDDSPLDLQLATEALRAVAEVETFADGSAMLERLASSPEPDILVLDWVMPGISGIEVVRFLRAPGSRFPPVPVLLLTAQSQPAQIADGLAAGANDYLPKPWAPEELRARVDALFRSARLLERVVAAERMVRGLLENAPDALLVVDAAGVLTFANEQAVESLGRTPEELVGRHLSDVLPEFRLDNASPTVGRAEPAPDMVIGDRVYSPRVRKLPFGATAGATIALRDVTERRRMEERRLDFYSIAAHDLRTPLTAMLLRTDLLLNGGRGPLSAPQITDLRRFMTNIRSMISMINDFLDLARLEGAEGKLQRDPLDLAEVVTATVDDLHALAAAGKLALRWHPPEGTVRVSGDRGRLIQVVSNLIGNAIKFTPPEGEVEVRMEQKGRTVETRIHDNGPGIPPEALPRLFDRFTRGAAARTIGAGLGLMIVRQIVEAHGGTVGVDSQVGAGSTFWFRLPVLDEARISPPPA